MSRLQNAMLAMDQLDALELECLKTHLQKRVQDLPTSAFRFLDLPAELRNRIYFLSGIYHLSETRRYPGDDPFKIFPHKPRPHPLLAISRQIRKEFMDIYYSEILTFAFPVPARGIFVETTSRDLAIAVLTRPQRLSLNSEPMPLSKSWLLSDEGRRSFQKIEPWLLARPRDGGDDDWYEARRCHEKVIEFFKE